MIPYQILFLSLDSYTTGSKSGVGTAYPSGAPIRVLFVFSCLFSFFHFCYWQHLIAHFYTRLFPEEGPSRVSLQDKGNLTYFAVQIKTITDVDSTNNVYIGYTEELTNC